MIRKWLFLGFWVVIACSLLAAAPQAQTQPPAQAPPAAPPKSPAVISPAIIGPLEATAPAPPGTPAKADPAKGKNVADASTVPPKDPLSVGPPYVIGPEDGLLIRVWQNAELSGGFNVGPDGMISLPLINEVRASGLTAPELAEELKKRFKAGGFLVEPEVNVQVTRPISRTYIILGDGVARPGIYPLPKPMTILEALLAGGSFTPFAKKKQIYLMRGTQKFPFNYNDVSKGKNTKQNIIVQNGDQIYVPGS